MRCAAVASIQPLMGVAEGAIKTTIQTPFRILFCPGLGSSKRDIIANRLQYWAIQRNIPLETLVLF